MPLFDAYGHPIPESSQRQVPAKEQKESDAVANNARSETQPRDGRTISPGGNEQIHSESEQQAEHEEAASHGWLHHIPQWGTFAATTFAFIAAFWYACTAHRQMGVMEMQNLIMNQAFSENRRQGLAVERSAAGAIGSAQAAKRQANISEKAFTASEAQSKRALDASIEMSYEERRAWVGVIEVKTVGGKEEKDRFGIQSVSIAVRNSGKTPALKMNVGHRDGIKLWSDPIPDYETFGIAPQDRLEELKRNNPKFAAEMQQAAIHFTVGGMVLPPDVPREVTLATETSWSIHVENKLPSGKVRTEPATIYLLGEILYSDVFTGTPQRSTKFCLMRTAPASSFSICPTGNWME
jgi:hypothetical protein